VPCSGRGGRRITSAHKKDPGGSSLRIVLTASSAGAGRSGVIASARGLMTRYDDLDSEYEYQVKREGEEKKEREEKRDEKRGREQ